MIFVAHRFAPVDSCLSGNDVFEGATKLGTLRSTLGESGACDVSTRAERLCVVTTHNRDQEV